MTADKEPQSLKVLFKQWAKEISGKELTKFFNLPEDRAKYTSHMGMRNSLGLWGFSPVAQELMDADIWHGDDMGCVVTLSFHRYLHKLPIDLEGQAKYFKEWWESRHGEGYYLQMKQDRLQYLNKDGHNVSRWE